MSAISNCKFFCSKAFDKTKFCFAEIIGELEMLYIFSELENSFSETIVSLLFFCLVSSTI